MIKITKSKGDFKIEGLIIFSSEYYKEVKKVNSWENGRPSRLRDTNETQHTVNSFINEENLKLLNEKLSLNITVEDIEEKIKNSGPEYFSMGRSKDWTSKAFGVMLNEIIGKKIFINYND